MKYVTLGPEGTYSDEATQRWGAEEVIYRSSPQEVVEAISNDVMGVLAIENSIQGTVVRTVDLLRTSDVMIRGEVILEINHCLIGDQGTEPRLVVSHPQAIAQCREFLVNNYPGVETRPTDSTAKAVELAKEKRDVFAIAPEASAKKHDLFILEKGIQDVTHNQTRFIVLGSEDREPSGDDKSSLIFYVRNEPGSLYKCLGAFAENNVNLTKLESRPSREALGDYYFYIDFEGHRNDEEVKESINELRKLAKEVKFLGSYPKHR